jgi:hypothetical protein
MCNYTSQFPVTCIHYCPESCLHCHCSLAVFSGRCSPSSGFPNCPHASATVTPTTLPLYTFWQITTAHSNSRSWLHTLDWFASYSKLYYEWQSVGQSVLVSGTHLGSMTRYLLLSDSSGFFLCRVSSLMRGQACSLQLLLDLTSTVILGSKSLRTQTIFYSLKVETPSTWSARSLYLYPPGTGWRRHWVPFSSPLMICRAMMEVFVPPPRRDIPVVKVKVVLQLMVSRPVTLGVRHPAGAHDQIVITVRQLQICWWWAPSLVIGWVYSLQLLLDFTSAVFLGSESRWAYNHILPTEISDSHNLEGQVPIFTSPRNGGGGRYIPRHCIPFSSPHMTRRATVEICVLSPQGRKGVATGLLVLLIHMIKPQVGPPT